MLSKEDALRQTAQMWKWLAENSTMSKTDYFKENGIPHDMRPENYCYCCQYALEQYAKPVEKMNEWICIYCPIPNWGGTDCEAFHSPYSDWINAVNNLDAAASKKAALAIVALAEKQLLVLNNDK